MSWTGPLARRINPKWIILSGEGMLVAATVLLAFADGPDKYWPFVFPAFVLGSGGAMLTYTHTNIAIFRTSPASMAGTVGAIFNGALQLGSAVGIAAVDSLQASVQAQQPDTPYAGQRAAFWFLLGVVGVELLAMALFYRTGRELPEGAGAGVGKTDGEEKVRDVDEKLAEVEDARVLEPAHLHAHEHGRVVASLSSMVEAARAHGHFGHSSQSGVQTPRSDMTRVGFFGVDEEARHDELEKGSDEEKMEVEVEERRLRDSPVWFLSFSFSLGFHCLCGRSWFCFSFCFVLCH